MGAEYAAPVDPREGAFQFNDFRGLRNNVGANTFLPGDLSTALNVDIDDALNIKRRKGYSTPVTAGIDRDIWASGSICLGVGGDTLKMINPDYSTTTLRAGLTAGRHLDYEAIGDRVFWSNGVEAGVVQAGVNRSWGISVSGKAVATAASGALLAGLYQYAVTYLRNDGQESGAGLAGTITLASAGGIALSSIPVSSDAAVTYKAIYATSVGGETLYQVGVIPNAQTTFLIDTVRAGASPLLTQFLQPPPAGDFIAESRGCMLVAIGSRLYPSEPYSPELFDWRKAVPFDDVITMIAPVTEGVYIGTQSRIVWLQGDSPETWTLRSVAQYGAIPGTLSYADGELIGDGSTQEKVAMFATHRGLCVGSPNGQVSNLTESRFAYPIQPRGAGVVRRHRGMAQYLVTLQGPETAGNVAA